ncbi:F-box/lrr-repeat protein 6-like [Plakobranchus ocellatus]|uniref:F-box/lrr-repeat protein 6-like n=1 Tax=Plakobranchus ocellatus TaxID=259542 RepID=A0AAV4CU08_9GAST|nr:F-box/lrr-repeat protein 6-like [Plakobranchus ocellatus]
MSGRKRKERGLFGIVKSKSVLFTFKPRVGEEYSSDSEDSDYFPGRQSTDEDNVERKKLKAAKKKAKRTISSDSKSSHTRSSVRWGKTLQTIRLPPEILLQVFIFGVQSEGITRFLPQVSRVCKEWHAVASDPALLKHLNLSVEGGGSSTNRGRVSTLTIQRLKKLLSSRDLSQCQMISLAGQTKLKAGHIKSVLSHTPRLTSLNLRDCHVSSDILEKLPELTPCLERIDLSHLPTFGETLCFGHIEKIVSTFGNRLVELRLGRMPHMKNRVDQLLKTIGLCCPLLEELDLSLSFVDVLIVSRATYIDMGELAKACPRLKELRLNRHNLEDQSGKTQPYNPAFTNLKVYSQTEQIHDSNQHPVFYRMFSNNHLIELNLSHTNLFPSRVSSSGVKSVRKLYLANMRWGESDAGELDRCMSAWSESLEILDLSLSMLDWFNQELHDCFLQPRHWASLNMLNLSYSRLEAKTVVCILRNCKSLETIDLTACRKLPRECQRDFHQTEFKCLMKTLC